MALLFQEPAPWPLPPINRANRPPRTQEHTCVRSWTHFAAPLMSPPAPYQERSHRSGSQGHWPPLSRHPDPDQQSGRPETAAFLPSLSACSTASHLVGRPTQQPARAACTSSRSRMSRRRFAARSVGSISLISAATAAMYRSGSGGPAPSLARTLTDRRETPPAARRWWRAPHPPRP